MVSMHQPLEWVNRCWPRPTAVTWTATGRRRTWPSWWFWRCWTCLVLRCCKPPKRLWLESMPRSWYPVSVSSCLLTTPRYLLVTSGDLLIFSLEDHLGPAWPFMRCKGYHLTLVFKFVWRTRLAKSLVVTYLLITDIQQHSSQMNGQWLETSQVLAWRASVCHQWDL